jgi:hypothetical protein
MDGIRFICVVCLVLKISNIQVMEVLYITFYQTLSSYSDPQNEFEVN